MERIEEILSRGVTQFTDPEGNFTKALHELASGKRKNPVVIKFGVDPTRPDIHLGHAVILHKLRALQELGAKVIFLIGDFTAMIGDPTGKSKVRPEISQKEVEANMQTYLEQVGKILDTSADKFSWIRNSDWFVSPMDIMPNPDDQIEVDGKRIDPSSFVGKALKFESTRMQVTHLKQKGVHNISLINFLAILRRITHAKLIARDMFQDRINSGGELFLHEMMYPVFQAIDSHVLMKVYGSCDMEIGGSDQTFNMLMGRDVMKMTEQPPQAVMVMDLIEGTDGKEKMSKSLGNYIGITDVPADMYGKVMSIPDPLITRYAALATFTPNEDIAHMEKALKDGSVNPRDLKARVARQIVAIYHGEEKAARAEADFKSAFQEGKLPSVIPEIKVTKGTALVDAILLAKVLPSKTVYRRYVEEGAVRVEGGEKVTDPLLKISTELIVKIGKKDFLRIIPE